MTPEERLVELGLELPAPQTLPFVPRIRSVLVRDGIAYVSGNGIFDVTGRVGADVSPEQAYEAARLTALAVLRDLRDELGSLNKVDRWLKVVGYVRSAPEFVGQPAVINGFTDLIIEIYGEERGLCARTAVGVAELPAGIAVEVDAIVAIR